MITGHLSNCPECRQIKCSCHKAIGGHKMTIEELLEALPYALLIKGEAYKLQLSKLSGRKLDGIWEVSYWTNNGYDFTHHTGSLREALEAVYQDLKDNNLI